MKILFVQNEPDGPLVHDSVPPNAERVLLEELAQKGHVCHVVAPSGLAARGQGADGPGQAERAPSPDPWQVRIELEQEIRAFAPTWVVVVSPDPAVLDAALASYPDRVIYLAPDLPALPVTEVALLRQVAEIVARDPATAAEIARATGRQPVLVPGDDPGRSAEMAAAFEAALERLLPETQSEQIPLPPPTATRQEDVRSRLQALSPERRALLARRAQQKEREAAPMAAAGIAIPARPPGEALPLSFAQQRLWFVAALQPENPAYHEVRAARLSGPLDLTALASSLATITARHEILRTTYQVREGQPVQRIGAALPVQLELHNLESLPAAEREADAERLALQAAQRPFDIEQGPILRACVLRMAPDDHILLLVIHHIATDGWSWSVLLHELSTLYGAATGAAAAKLPELPLQYADYALWQRAWLQGEALDTLLAYWRRRLADAPAGLDLPTDRPRPATKSYRTARHAWSLPATTTEALTALAQGEGTTLFILALAAFNILLQRYSGQDDILVGTDIANRTRAEAEGLIGFFVNQLVLRSDLGGNPSFRALLRAAHATTLEAYAHQDVPFDLLVKELNPARGPNQTPFFQVKLVLQNTPMAQLDLPGLGSRKLDIDPRISQFDLQLELYREAEGLRGWMEYDADLFDGATITRMLEHFSTLLAGIVARPDAPIAELPLLPEHERRQLVQEWSATGATPLDHCVALFEAQAARRPDAVAVYAGDAGLTYRELNRRANQLAHYLRNFGVQPEVVVALGLERSFEFLVGVLGTWKAGGAYVPLDLSYPQERLDVMLHTSQAALLLTREELVDALPNTWMPTIFLDSEWEQIAEEPEENLDTAVDPANLAYTIYTSGSTGQPKGVQVPYGGLGNLAAAQIAAFEVMPDSRVLQFASISFDAAVADTLMALLSGATLYLPDREQTLPGQAMIRLLQEQAITTVTLPPSILAALPAAHLPSLRTLIVAGEACPPELVQQWSAGCRVVNAYGPTEASVCATLGPAGDGREPPPLGQPIANVETYVLDAHLQPAPIGVPGELYIGGAGLARGYAGRADLTAERFIPNPFGENKEQRTKNKEQRTENQEPRTDDEASQPVVGGRWSVVGGRLYRTGDRVRYRADGAIEFLGRVDSQVKLRGFRIELGEIEAVLRRHPAVREAAVLAREDAPGEQRLVAYVVPSQEQRTKNKEQRTENREPRTEPDDKVTRRQGDKVIVEAEGSEFTPSPLHPFTPSLQELRDYLQTRLPDYMVPAAFVALDALPLTPSGKLDRRALPEPEAPGQAAEAEFAAPRTPTEELLAQIWAEVLHVARVGIHDHFFDLGGHSLLATQIIARMRDAFGVEVPLRVFMEAPTVARLAEQLAGAGATAAHRPPPLRPMPRDGDSSTSSEQGLPLSFAQQRMWLLDQLENHSPSYNIPCALRLSGPLDLEALGQSLNAIVRRHESLRTTFVMRQDQPVQVIAPALDLPLPLVELHHVAADGRAAEALRRAVGLAMQPFDPSRDALVRAQLLRLAPDEHVLALAFHHIVADGWSIGVFLDELTALYGAAGGVETAPLPPLPVQYADYALWQRGWLHGEVLDAQMDYWRRHLAGLDTLSLPTDRPRPATPTFAGATKTVALPSSLSADLAAFSRGAGVTPFMTLLAAFQVLLARYSGQDDITIGTDVANRTHAEAEPLIGFFVNQLVLRADLSGNPTVRELLARVRQITLDAYSNQDVPFEYLVQALNPERSLSNSPLFQVKLILQNDPLTERASAGVAFEPLEIVLPVARFDLVLLLNQGAGELTGELTYATDLFDDATIARMLAHFQVILQAIVADPEQRIAALPLLTPEEQRQALVEWNATATAIEPAPIHESFAAQVARTPAAPALVDAGQQLTYAELDARANQLAHELQLLGVGPEVLVGIYLERSIDLFTAILAVLKAGGAYLPLDPRYPTARLDALLTGGQAAVVLTHEHLVDALPVFWGMVIELDSDWERIADHPTSAPAGSVSAENLAYVIYTSGSTGQPKGVQVTHRGLGNLAAAQIAAFEIEAGSRLLQFASASFDASVSELWTTLLAGATLVLPPADMVPAGAELARLLDEQQITHVTLPPSVLATLPAGALATVRSLVVAGEACPAELIERWAAGRRMLNAYGPTEATVCATISAPLAADQPLTIGRPIANTQVYLLDADLRPVPVGVAGELYIGGIGLARGYTRQPDVTAERFIPNPFLKIEDGGWKIEDGTPRALDLPSSILHPPSSRLYRTGDRARYRADGAIEYLGRRDEQVKLRGYRVELGEIEAVLGQHPGVREAAVLVREDAQAGPQLVAYVVPSQEQRTKNKEQRTENREPRTEPNDTVTRRQGDKVTAATERSEITPSPLHPFTPSLQELRGYLQERLPDYMVPALFVALDRLPLSPNGKLDRRALLALEAPQADREAAGPATRTPAEDLLIQIWGEVLGQERVGIHDDFFALGGHSLLGTQIIVRVRDIFGVEFSLRGLFETPTVAGLAAQISAARGDRPETLAPPLRPAPRNPDGGRGEEPPPLSFAQQRLWFLDQLQPGQATYNMPIAWRLRGPLDVAALERSLGAIMERHEVLRTTFTTSRGQPVQVIAAADGTIPLPLHDLQQLPAEQREAELARRVDAEALRPFDLTRGPLLRAHLFGLAGDEHVLMLTMHHSVFDGWSMQVFIHELRALYVAGTSGAGATLPELPIQYADYAVWQRGWLQGAVREAQLDYWRRQLSDLAPLELPTERPRPAMPTFQGASSSFALSPELSAALDALSRREGVTLFMTLLAAWQVLLARYSGQDDIAVGSPVAGRLQQETEALIGCFVNTLVLRTQVRDDLTFPELLRQVREVCLGAYGHQDLPFEQLVEELQPERDLSRHPLFQVMFAFQNDALAVLELPDLTLQPVAIPSTHNKFDLSLFVIRDSGGVSGEIQYATDLFGAQTIARMLGHFEVLLEGIAADPDGRVSALPLLTEAEERQLLVEWAAPPLAAPAGPDLLTQLVTQAARTPNAVALACEGTELTYGELLARATQLAHYLRRRGVGPEVRVGLCLERSAELVVGLLGILLAGGAYVPLDPAYPPARLAYMLEDAQVSVLLTSKEIGDRRLEIDAASQSPISNLQSPTAVYLDTDWPTIAREPAESLDSGVTPDNLAYIIYTSGSTGQPKGVQVEHRQLLHTMRASQQTFGVRPDDVGAWIASVAFDITLFELLLPLLAGARVQIVTSPQTLDPAGWQAVLAPCTLLHTVPSLMRQLLDVLAEAPPPLRQIFVGGEAVPPELLTQLRATFPQARLHVLYGPTEATIICSHAAITADPPARLLLGRPLPNVQLRVYDARGRLVPVGVPGELYIGGPGVARGYWQREELTVERFIPDPFGENKGQRTKNKEPRTENQEPRTDDEVSQLVVGGRWSVVGGRLYRTGDRARYLADGTLEYLGRTDAQVKLRGYRIELGEVEAALTQHPAVRAGAVLLREDAPGEQRLVAYLVVRDWRLEIGDSGADNLQSPISNLQQELRAFLKERLPDYMVPSAFVMLERLPLTAHGKVDRKALPAPDGSRPLDGAFVAPGTPAEEVVAQIWAEVLRLERIGIHDNFFATGGHSLLATQVAVRLREAFQVDVPLRSMFDTPTVAGIVDELARLWGGRAAVEEVAQVFQELEQLSEDEAITLLSD